MGEAVKKYIIPIPKLRPAYNLDLGYMASPQRSRTLGGAISDLRV